MSTIKLVIQLNGTNVNPFHALGFKQNPFPQIGRAQYDVGERAINRLGAEPIPDTDHIRKVLKDFALEFVDLCCKQFKKGEMVTFTISFEDDR